MTLRFYSEAFWFETDDNSNIGSKLGYIKSESIDPLFDKIWDIMEDHFGKR